ncbi:MAG: glycine--tRNA ligase [Planctomycetota bacterium]|nr:MAG: glycine--tRNA ligase [Planctomycetota bacterium]
MSNEDLMQKIVSLCKKRGFVFQSSEIYGGLKSAYDYGPLGVELKRNIMAEWWKAMVHEREDIVGIDASIIMKPDVWKASGHLSSFTDPLVDCLICKERFRADKAEVVEQGSDAVISFSDKGKAKVALETLEKMGHDLKRNGKEITGATAERNYVCTNCGSPFLSEEKNFNLMFKTSLGAVDNKNEIVQMLLDNKDLSKNELIKKIEDIESKSAVYLRPETAQAMFVQFNNVMNSMSMKLPFGIAQQGKSFRNEITVEHFIFRSCEFEQMEMEYFCYPEQSKEKMEYWKETRFNWYIDRLGINKEKLRLRAHDDDELAFYSDSCYDVEYAYPWGWDELEGIASRTDYDLKQHEKHSKVKLQYFDAERINPETGKKGMHFTPYVIEPAAGATRTTLMVLIDAYDEEPGVDGKEGRTVLRLLPRLAPIKVAIFPLVKKDGMPDKARTIAKRFTEKGINCKYEEQHAIGKRYRRHDEIGTPFCLTIDTQTMDDDTITIRYRDDMRQERINIEDALSIILEKLN